ncbi:MAG: hypothetical protein JWM77_961 [Rhodospirillales bacterium]|nr:hypothetical protein [Rhodospirillales bacterium]
MDITLADIAPLSLGAAILGTGGGGDPYIGHLALRHLIEQTAPPTVIDVDSLADDAFVITVGMTGSPSVMLEKLVDRSFADAAVRRFERLVGRRADAVLPVEIGGVNSLVPLMTSCVTGLPVLDADGMGRAFPTLDRTSFGIAGVSPFPVVTINERHDTVIVEATSHERGERISRGALVPMGASGSCALYPMTGREAKETTVRGTMSLALALGRAVEAARAAKADPFEAILATVASAKPKIFGRVLFEGKITDITRETIGGYNIGTGILSSGGEDDATFGFQNELLYLKQGSELLAIVPDLICFLDSETAQPAMCETLRYGQRITAMGFAATSHFRTAAGLAATGPASFGLRESYVEIERLGRQTPAAATASAR